MVAAVNLEAGMPTVEIALRRLELGLDARMRHGPRALIHGYGSSGRGGAIHDGVHSHLARMSRRQRLEFVPGRNFPHFRSRRAMRSRSARSSPDRDFARENRGVTLVVL
ncbi:MAG: hypothetical protein ACLVL7_00180 [Anaerotruncus massiliensis (ex Togo et al. 2019)]